MTVEFDSLKEVYANGIALRELYHIPTNTLIWRLAKIPTKVYGSTYSYNYIYY